MDNRTKRLLVKPILVLGYVKVGVKAEIAESYADAMLEAIGLGGEEDSES